MAQRNAAKVLPDPVGASRSVFSPRRITGQASFCAGEGALKVELNHRRTQGKKPASDLCGGFRVPALERPLADLLAAFAMGRTVPQ